MRRHPYFDLWLHDADELSQVTGSPVVERQTLHEWPLSCVQRLTGADGRTYIYKAQAEPSVEPSFYAQARSPLLVSARALPSDGQPAALMLEDVRAPKLSDIDLAPADAIRIGDDLLAEIARIEGDLPALLDIRTQALWLAHAQAILENLHSLVKAGSFQLVNEEMIEQVGNCGRSTGVLAVIADSPTGYVHMDFSAENVLVLADGYKVLDWQRPAWGPTALDKATLLESVGIPPGEYVSPGVLKLRALLLIDWLAQCACRWFPPGAATYDRQIAEMIMLWCAT